ncbi:MAG: hypothetical protein IT309_05440, partial [Anaerolineales bacterium]|nr:hypothetical protein [Anaerolineales bacterium]
MKPRLTIDSLAIGLILFLAAIAGFVIWVGESAGVSVRVDLPEDGLVGPYRAITFKFSEVVSAEMASELIALDPIHEGYLQTVDDTSVRFVPLQPFDPEITYTVKVIAGETNIKGREVKKPQSWEFRIREPRVAYMVTAGGQ